MRTSLLALTVIGLLGLATACGSGDESTGEPQPGLETTQPVESPPLPQGSEPFDLDPADFVAEIDNPFWPMAPGSTWVYRETDAEGNEQQVEVTVTDETRMILGIEATVVHDVVSADGTLVEDTHDWYAQDRWGNVWYLGEDTTEYEGGEPVSTAGSWEAGVDGALAGVIMPAQPEVGLAYRQEYYAGEAEDAAEVLSLDEHAEVPYGTYDGLLMTYDFTPLDPNANEHKHYARGVGPVLTLALPEGSGKEELLSFEGGT